MGQSAALIQVRLDSASLYADSHTRILLRYVLFSMSSHAAPALREIVSATFAGLVSHIYRAIGY